MKTTKAPSTDAFAQIAESLRPETISDQVTLIAVLIGAAIVATAAFATWASRRY